jgi:hypothetical protein
VRHDRAAEPRQKHATLSPACAWMHNLGDHWTNALLGENALQR